MNGIRKKLFILAVILQCFVLLAMITRQEMLLRTGTKVMLKCVPVDPRSLFSGDYVRLNYEISDIEDSKLPGEKRSYREGDTIYVALVKNRTGNFYSAAETSVSIDKLAGRYPVIIKGTVESPYINLHIRYGIESYFVPQNEGKDIGMDMADVSAEVSVAEDGRSALSRLFFSGREVKFY